MLKSAGGRRGRVLASTVAIAAAAVFGWSGTAANAASSMTTGGLTSQPIGHYEFCLKYPAECSIRPQATGPVKLTRALWQNIQIINSSINRSITPVNDIELHNKEEVWSYPTTKGDCEDYVLLKRKELMRRGISLSNLLITVVRKWDGEGHAILTLRTDQGDFILDNLTDQIKAWDHTGYRFLKRQASDHTGRWVEIRSTSTPFVGSVRK